MPKRTGGWVAAVTVIVLLAWSTPAQADTRCAKCYEVIDDTQQPWVYYHGFDSQGVVWRECEGSANLLGDHDSCHNDPVEGDCGTHSTCSGGGGTLAALTAEIQELLAATSLSVPDPAAIAALNTRIRESANVTFTSSEGVLRVRDCDGRVVARWAISDRMLRRLLYT